MQWRATEASHEGIQIAAKIPRERCMASLDGVTYGPGHQFLVMLPRFYVILTLTSGRGCDNN